MRKYLIPSLLVILLPGLASAQLTAMRPGRVRIITNQVTDIATTADIGGWIEWRSPIDQNKTQTLPPCNTLANGLSIGVADGQATAGVRNINVEPSGSQAISGGNVSIKGNGGSMQFVCNGAGNWIVAGQFAGITGEMVPTITDVTVNPNYFVADGVAKNVGTLSASLSAGSFNGTLSISPEAGSNPDNMFVITGTLLRANANATQTTHTVIIRATQGGASNNPHDFPLTVVGTGPVPIISSPTSVDVTEGEPFSYEIRATCQGGPCAGDNAITAFNVTSPLPAGLSQSGPLGEDIIGVLPVTEDYNRWSVSINARNVHGTGQATLLLNIRPPNP